MFVASLFVVSLLESALGIVRAICNKVTCFLLTVLGDIASLFVGGFWKAQDFIVSAI
jgi:hypothetical protein